MSTTQLTLTAQVVIAMLLGITVGLLINVSGLNAAGSFVNEYIVNGLFKAVGTLFVNALKMLVVPLVLFSLICGVCGIGNLNTLGRVGAKSFVLYLRHRGCYRCYFWRNRWHRARNASQHRQHFHR